MDALSGLRTALYPRFSSDNQKDTSIDDQVRLCRGLLARHSGSVPDELVLCDYAVSGVSKARDGFDRLLRLIETRAVDLVVTESADRLSRDLGDADRLWKLCEFHNVRLICVSDGIDSARDGSRMQFQFKAVMSDQYLVNLGKQTLRGLRGAAERGTSTGGLAYGYTSRAIWSGKREPDGYEILVDTQEAAIVVRVFELYRDGHSFLSIASTLNADGVPPPRAESRRHPTKFWKKSTIREMLSNAAYVGRWSFGRKRWRKDPITRKRRYLRRPDAEVMVADRPHLRLVPDLLWEVVQARRSQVRVNYAGKGDGAPGQRTRHPFAGLLFCAVCGHRMVDAGGSSSRYYRCSAASSGNACLNKQLLREDALLEAALTELRRVLLKSDLHEALRTKIEKRLASFRARSGDEKRRLERELRRLDAEAERLVAFIRSTDAAQGQGAFEAVRAALERVTTTRRGVEEKLASLRDASAEPRIPTVAEIMAYVLDVEVRFKEDPTAAREALRQLLVNGKLVMEPQADGSYVARSVILPMQVSWKTRKPRNLAASGASGAFSTEVVEGGSCAGRI